MMIWWMERRSRLWWKELREIWPVVGLGWIVIMAMLTKLPSVSSVSSRYIWGIDFNLTAVAILFFVALVLGVTAYAIEEESETLEVLLAKPIKPDDILATKLGVRLGLLFFSWLVVGMVEIWSGGWPIQYGVPAVFGFERWLGGLMMLVLGLGLGFYFGKITGRQIAGLMSALLVVAAGWSLLELSPLSFLFEGEEGRGLFWVRSILIPGIVGTAAILASIPARTGHRGFMTRPIVAILALAGYALVFWSFTVVPPGQAWKTQATYRAHWTTRFAGPEKVIRTLLDEYIREVPRRELRDPDSLAVELIMDTVIYRDPVYDREESLVPRSTLFQGYSGNRVLYSTEMSIRDLSSVEELAVTHRGARFIRRCLEVAQEPDCSSNHRIVALHLAGLAAHPEHTELIASFLDDNSLFVKIMTAFMLAAREDPRGEESLIGMLPTIDSLPIDEAERLQQDVADMVMTLGLDPGPDLGPLAREWALLENQLDYSRRRFGQSWLMKYGSMDDLNLIRRSRWLDNSINRRRGLRLEDINVLNYLEAWNAPDYTEILYQQALWYRSEFETLRPEIIRLEQKRRLTVADQLTYSRHRGLLRYLEAILNELAEKGDLRVIDLWQESRHLLREYYLGSIPVITSLPGLGEPGFQLLMEFVANPKEKIPVRFNAALILAYHGYREYDEFVMRFFELYMHSEDMMWFRYGSILNAFLILAMDGQLQYLGPVISEAWSYTQAGDRSLRPYRYYLGWDYYDRGPRVGSPLWNIKIVAVLKQVSGRNFGWNLKAWKKWWEREGMHIVATDGNN